MEFPVIELGKSAGGADWWGVGAENLEFKAVVRAGYINFRDFSV